MKILILFLREDFTGNKHKQNFNTHCTSHEEEEVIVSYHFAAEIKVSPKRSQPLKTNNNNNLNTSNK